VEQTVKARSESRVRPRGPAGHQPAVAGAAVDHV